MCTTSIEHAMERCFREPKQELTASPVPPAQRYKRDREGRPSALRPAKRVTFSARECVLGTAQDYDRRSFEEETSAVGIPTASRGTAAAAVSSSVPVADAAVVVGGSDHQGKANFCGMWRRSHGFNWATLLKFSGVDAASIPEQAAKMQSSSVVHLIDHDDVSFRLIAHSDSGTTQDQHFFIGGQPRPNPASTNATSTLANMRWAKNDQALVLTSVDPASGDEMAVSRHLATRGAVMVQHYRARCAKTGETAEAVTIFRRMVR